MPRIEAAPCPHHSAPLIFKPSEKNVEFYLGTTECAPRFKSYNADSCLKNVMGMNIKCKNMCKHMAWYCSTSDTALWWSSFSENLVGALAGAKVKAKFVLCHQIKT